MKEVRMREKIKKYFENLNPKKIGLKEKVKVSSVKRLGMGAANANYLVKANGKKFVFRMNIQSGNENFSKKEYTGLKAVEKLKIAPKAWILDTRKDFFDSSFLVLSYIEGKICPHRKSYFDKKVVEKIGKLLGKVHSIPIIEKLKKLPKGWGIKGYKGYVSKFYQENFPYIKENLRNKEMVNMIQESYNELIKNLPNGKYKSKIVLSHGDFHDHNILVHNKEFKLIDFESIGLDDNAIEIACAFMEFDNLFDSKDRNLFIKSYLKIAKGNFEELNKKVFTWLPLRYFTDFLWAVRHVLKLRNKEMHSHYIHNTDFVSHVNYAKKTFRICLREGIIDRKYKNLDIKKVLMK